MKRILLLIFCSSAILLARDKFVPALPFHEIFPTSNGIIFPSILVAPGVNAAAIPQKGSSFTLMSVSYSPPATTGEHRYSYALAHANKNYGLGINYLGSYNQQPDSGFAFGAGFKAESTSIGLSMRQNSLLGEFSPDTDLGLIARTSSEVTFGFVLYHLSSLPRLDMGIGFSNDRNYNFEINILLPEFGNLFRPGYGAVITAATTVYASIFGISFRSSYDMASSVVTQSVSILVWLTKGAAISAQYISPNRSYYGLIFDL